MALSDEEIEHRKARGQRLQQVMNALRHQLPKTEVAFIDGPPLDLFGLPLGQEHAPVAIAVKIQNPEEAYDGGHILVQLNRTGNPDFDEIYFDSVLNILGHLHGFKGYVKEDRSSYCLQIDAQALTQPPPTMPDISPPAAVEPDYVTFKRGNGRGAGSNSHLSHPREPMLVDICALEDPDIEIDISYRQGSIIIDSSSTISSVAREMTRHLLTR